MLRCTPPHHFAAALNPFVEPRRQPRLLLPRLTLPNSSFGSVLCTRVSPHDHIPCRNVRASCRRQPLRPPCLQPWEQLRPLGLLAEALFVVDSLFLFECNDVEELWCFNPRLVQKFNSCK